eukprot:RCo002643
MSWVSGILGGLAATTASVITHPMDSVKVRMYLYGEGQANAVPSLALARHIYSTEGLPAFYRGVSATVLRQGIFSTVRFALNDYLQKASPGQEEAQVWLKLLSSGLSGVAGAVAACPADTVLVRMQADGKLSAELRRNYRNVFHGLVQISRDEGPKSLFRGVSPLVARGCVVTAAQFTTYDVAKSLLMNSAGLSGTAISTHLLASTLAGIVTTLVSNPVDVVKSRVMYSRAFGAGGPGGGAD